LSLPIAVPVCVSLPVRPGDPVRLACSRDFDCSAIRGAVFWIAAARRRLLQATFLAGFAKAAGAGEMLNIHELKAAYEKAIGHRTSNSTVYSLLARHGWRKLMPRPFHPDRDVEAQNTFKTRAFLMLSGKLGGPLQPAVVVYGSCSPTKRGSASTMLGANGVKAESCVPAHSRIHLPLWSGQLKGWSLLLLDHADC
jgi:hypothetical protein